MRLATLSLVLHLLLATCAFADVEFAWVTARCEAGPRVSIRWLTLSEDDTNGFQVLRDGLVLSLADAHGPNLEYAIEDLTPATGAPAVYCVQELTNIGVGERSPNVTTGEVPPPDQGNALLATRSGLDVRLAFSAAPDAPWGVYRDTDRRSTGVNRLAPVTAVPGFLDTAALSLPETVFYHVKGVTPCSYAPGP